MGLKEPAPSWMEKQVNMIGAMEMVMEFERRIR